MLLVDGVAFNYGEQSFCYDLSVEAGEILSVIGPSGSGKSTLLHLIGGFLEPSAGTMRINDNDITAMPPESRPVTTVFQEHNLFPHLTVFDNTALGIHPGLRLDQSDRRRIGDALDRVQLAGLADRRPAELSGGQRQRVALARALVRAQPALLLDEPLIALGPALRRELLQLIRELVTDQAMAALLVSHHPDDARVVSQRTAFVHDGRIHKLCNTDSLFADQDDDKINAYLGQE